MRTRPAATVNHRLSRVPFQWQEAHERVGHAATAPERLFNTRRLTKMLHIRTFLHGRVLAGTLALALAAPLVAHGSEDVNLRISHPWTRATPTGASTAVGYMKITNNGKDSDRLIAATAEGADKVEVHEMSMDNNVMKMRQLKEGVEIPPGETVELKPGGFHLMMIGLRTQFKEGETVKGTLGFEKGGSIDIEFKVEALGGGSRPTAEQREHRGH
jgi:copper(I)-binding protein